jgi:hypothetical protein
MTKREDNLWLPAAIQLQTIPPSLFERIATPDHQWPTGLLVSVAQATQPDGRFCAPMG